MRYVLLAVASLVLAAPAFGAHSNHASKQPAPARDPRLGPKYDHHCASRTLRTNYRGLCVRSLQWLLTGSPDGPNVRPAKKARGVNHSRHYWHIRPQKPTGHYYKTTVLQVQKAKRQLGYPVERANGDAGPLLRKYLLGQKPLPQDYRSRSIKRFLAWRARLEHAPPRGIKRLLALAYQAIDWHDHYYYTQTGHRSDFLNGLGPPWPKGGDCSGSVSALYHLAHLPATGSVSPYDWTGSMQDRGHVVWHVGESLTRLKPGDLIFYGYGGAPFTHVAMVLSTDGGRVYSFGSNGCPCNNSTLYRSDARIARRYVG